MSEIPSLSSDSSDLEHAAGAIRLLIDLLGIDGVSCEEKKISAFIREQLLAAGLAASCCVDDGALERIGFGSCGNLIVDLPGRGALASAERILLSAHMDTVPLCRGTRVQLDPVRRVIHSDGTTALGADNRTGCAAILHAARELLCSSQDCRPATLVFFVQEEIGLKGSRALDVSLLRNPQFGVNVDGGATERIYVGGIGAADWRAAVRGIPAHAAVHPEDGVSSVAVTALALTAIHKQGWHGRIQRGDAFGTANVGAISGGNASNVVADVVEVSGEARSHDQLFLKEILAAIKSAFIDACGEIQNVNGDRAQIDFEQFVRYQPFRLPDDNIAAVAVIDKLSGPASLEVSDGGVDANNLNNLHGIPTVTIGAGAHHLHTINEYCNLDEFLSTCVLLNRLLAE